MLFASTVVFLELTSHSRKARRQLCFFYTFVLFLLELSGLTYCFYFFHYGNPLDEIALLSILATTPREAYNYLSSLFSPPLLAGLLLALTAGFRLLFHGVETGCRRAACRTLEGKKWIILPLVLLYFWGNYLASNFASVPKKWSPPCLYRTAAKSSSECPYIEIGQPTAFPARLHRAGTGRKCLPG